MSECRDQFRPGKLIKIFFIVNAIRFIRLRYDIYQVNELVRLLVRNRRFDVHNILQFNIRKI